MDNTDVVRRGGILALPELMLVNVHEIVRCTALSLRRRSEIMGVACRYDPLSAQLTQALSARPVAGRQKNRPKRAVGQRYL